MQLCQPADSSRQAAAVELGQRLLGVCGEWVQYPWRVLQHSPLVTLARQLAQHVPPGAEVDGSAQLAFLCVCVNKLLHGGEPSAAPAAAPAASTAARDRFGSKKGFGSDSFFDEPGAAAAPSAPSARDRALYHGGIGSDAFFGDGAPEEEDGIAGALSSAFSSLSRLG